MNSQPAGNYEIKVFSTNNDSRYSLAVGETESFPPGVIIKTLIVVPQLKRDFFASSPFTFLKSMFGIAYVVIMIVLAFIFGFIYRLIARRAARNNLRRRSHNMGARDRLSQTTRNKKRLTATAGLDHLLKHQIWGKKWFRAGIFMELIRGKRA